MKEEPTKTLDVSSLPETHFLLVRKHKGVVYTEILRLDHPRIIDQIEFTLNATPGNGAQGSQTSEKEREVR